jgi:hypothetical protein
LAVDHSHINALCRRTSKSIPAISSRFVVQPEGEPVANVSNRMDTSLPTQETEVDFDSGSASHLE